MSNEHGLVARWKLVAAASRDKRVRGTGDLAVLIAVADRINAEGVAWPSLSTIARDVDLDRSTVVRILKRLTGAGYLLRESGGRTSSNRYRLGDLARCVDASRCTDAPRRTDAPGVGAPARLGVGAQMHPEPASLNLPQEPASAPRPAAAYWNDGVAFLRAQGKSESSARQLLGKLKSARPDADEILQKALAMAPVDGAGFLMAHANRTSRPVKGRLPRDARSLDDFESANDDALAFVGGGR